MAHLDTLSVAQQSPQAPVRPHLYRRGGKRALDLALALLLLPLVLPLVAVLCVLARQRGASALFAHTRIGQGGKPFACWKIRTMQADAEARLAAHLDANPAAAREWERSQKLENDPRITPFGRVLRRTSLDELPQIWNVLRGDMSLVGPRPVTAPELARYGRNRHIYLDLKPGVTGLWQVTARADGCYAQRLQLDQIYARQVGLPQDLKLIARTALVILRPTGR